MPENGPKNAFRANYLYSVEKPFSDNTWTGNFLSSDQNNEVQKDNQWI